MNPQNAAADPEVSCFLTANAGSGKTSTLVNRVARLLLRGAKPEHILCVTYTKAAAAEMQGRLYERLGGWAVAEDAALADELRQIDENPDDLATARALFAQALETPGGLKIQTIHAFCEKLLRRFPLEAGLSPSFQVLDDLIARDLAAKALEGLLTLPEGAHRDHLIRTLKAQKFEQLLSQFIYQHDRIREALDGLRADAERTGLSFSAYIFKRLDLDPPMTPDQVVHAFANSLNWEIIPEMARSLATIGTKGNQNLSEALLKFCETRNCGGTFDFDAFYALFYTGKGEPRKELCSTKSNQADRDTLERWREPLAEAVEKRKAAETALNTLYTLMLFEDFSAIYQDLKRRTGALDFQDLISRAKRLLSGASMSQWVLFKMDGGLEHVLVDEGQDTSGDQWDIIDALVDDFFDGAGAPVFKSRIDRTIFAVGDEKQSIYGFQGAKPDLFLGKRQYYQTRTERAGKRFVVPQLVQSWRSLPQVLGFVDSAFDDPDLSEALNFTAERIIHDARRSERPATVELWPPIYPLPVPDMDDADDEDIAPVDASGAAPAKRLAQQLAFHIAQEIHQGRSVIDKSSRAPRPMHAGDVLILVRKRDALFEHIIRELKQAGVPVSGADRLKLSDHIAFQDLRALMRMCLQPGDSLSLAAVLRSPLCDISEDDLFTLTQVENANLWQALNRLKDNPRFSEAQSFIGWALSEAPQRTAFDFLGLVLNRRDDEGRTQRQRFITRLGVECEDVLDETLNLALKGEGVGAIGVIDFLNLCEFNASEIKREQEEGGDRVRVMTVHGSKGLEAPWVVLPMAPGFKSTRNDDLLLTSDEGDLFLSAQGKDGDPDAVSALKAARSLREAKEGLRLFYVALTRARDRLTLCGYRGSRAANGPFPDWYDLAEDGFARLPREVVTAVELDKAVEFGAPKDQEPSEKAELILFGERAPLMTAEARALQIQTGLPAFMAAAPVHDPEADVVWRAVSQLSDEDRSAEDRAPSPLAEQKGQGRFGRGLKIHKLFEILPALPVADRNAVAAQWLKRQPDLDDAQRDEIRQAVMGVLTDDRFADAFGPDSRPEVALAGQVGTNARGEAVFMSGRIDRLVIGTERVLVIDYKSNRPAPDSADEAAADYQRQMAGYVALLRQIYPQKQVEAALLWTDGPKLTPLSEALVNLRLAEIGGH
ncbi:double-strand break repair helicase AddA [Asticcacaulis sp. AND118]|uniref:double-strand break repair helicase AddA n=1 Tax=Asticcacaulis sp. AND118 TaxID=2840468 RepID=UPI001CFFA3D3|nr:double-strand break repair helicase AddA [Asticcacaulis sp. AND118]UDF03533.1 double-strand break repair helicase AddA [Asticcacaulis sp. AND118]